MVLDPSVLWRVLCCAVVCGWLLQALAAEVERRQAAVWAPQQDTPDAQLTPHQRQQRLKTARTVLAQRLQQQRQQQVQQAGLGLGLGAGNLGGGGFMPDGDGDDEAWEGSEGVLKRQRL
jgi:hypothetical protein